MQTLTRSPQVCDSRTLCPAALELLRASAARGAAGKPGEPPPPELLAKLLAALTAGDDDGGAEVGGELNDFRGGQARVDVSRGC
jgi:hypothetical protein